jgi:ABC-2 type transport system ATP-binding protein
VLRAIGLCPEHDVLYANVTAFDWVRYLLELHGFSRRQAGRRAESALEQVRLADAMHRRLGGYSRGMRQRTKLAQALAHDPELLILDEPFNGLDPIGRHEMIELLRDRIRAGRSVLFASHLLSEVEALTQSFLLFHGSRLLASGSAAEVRSLLVDLANEIVIRCSEARELAGRLVAEDSIEAVRLGGADDELVVSTRSPAALYSRLPRLAAAAGSRIHEIRSTDGSLQSLFSSLVQMRRGML